MNDLSTRTVDVIAVEINQIKAQTRTMMLCSSIEIGRRLVEAKGMVEHGQWGEWLEKQIDYSPRTAQNLMKIFEEYGADQLALFGDNAKTQTFADLTYSQAVALLGVPAEEREQFAEANKVDEMSTRELQAAIKERDELQRKLDNSHKAVEAVAGERDLLRGKTADLESSVAAGNQLFRKEQETVKMLQGELEKERQRTKDEVNRLVALLETARAEGKSNEEVKALTDQLEEARGQVEDLTKKLQQPVTLDPVVIEKVPDAVEQELTELRKLKQSAANPAVMKFSVHFEALVAGFQSLLADLAEIQETDPDKHDKYKNAVAGLIGKMTENL